MQVGVGPAVDRLDRIGGQVVELPLIVERVGAVLLAADAVGGQVPHAGFGPGGGIVEGAYQLPQVPPAARGVAVIDPHHQALEVGRGVRGNLDAQRRRRIRRQPQRPGDAEAPVSPSSMLSRVIR